MHATCPSKTSRSFTFRLCIGPLQLYPIHRWMRGRRRQTPEISESTTATCTTGKPTKTQYLYTKPLRGKHGIPWKVSRKRELSQATNGVVQVTGPVLGTHTLTISHGELTPRPRNATVASRSPREPAGTSEEIRRSEPSAGRPRAHESTVPHSKLWGFDCRRHRTSLGICDHPSRRSGSGPLGAAATIFPILTQ